jgi:hypothetical protein
MSDRKSAFELPCPVAINIQILWENGRKDEAELLAIKHLKEGFHSADLSKVLGKILEWKYLPRTKGQPKKPIPPNWYEIGSEFDYLKGDKHPTRTIKQLVKDGHGSIRPVREAVKYYQAVRAAHDEATRDFRKEQAGTKK